MSSSLTSSSSQISCPQSPGVRLLRCPSAPAGCKKPISEIHECDVFLQPAWSKRGPIVFATELPIATVNENKYGPRAVAVRRKQIKPLTLMSAVRQVGRRCMRGGFPNFEAERYALLYF